MEIIKHIYKSRHENNKKKLIIEAWCKLSTDSPSYDSTRNMFTKDIHGSNCDECNARMGINLLQNLP